MGALTRGTWPFRPPEEGRKPCTVATALLREEGEGGLAVFTPCGHEEL